MSDNPFAKLLEEDTVPMVHGEWRDENGRLFLHKRISTKFRGNTVLVLQIEREKRKGTPSQTPLTGLEAKARAEDDKTLATSDKTITPKDGEVKGVATGPIKGQRTKTNIKEPLVKKSAAFTSNSNSGNLSGYDTLKQRGYVVDESQRKITSVLQKIGAYKTKEIAPWDMPDNILSEGRKRRVKTFGHPETGADFARRVAGLFGKKLVTSTLGKDFTTSGSMVQNNPALKDYIFVDPRTPLSHHVIVGPELSHHIESDNTRQINHDEGKIQERF